MTLLPDRVDESMGCVAVVGNGPIEPGAASAIDAAACVIRFNLPKYNADTAGARTDVMLVVNAGFHLGRWIRDESLRANPYIAAARRVVLPWHPRVVDRVHPRLTIRDRLAGRKKHNTLDGLAFFNELEKEVSLLPEAFSLQCYRDLGIDCRPGTQTMPSTGFLGVRYALSHFPAASVRLYGFTWRGWDGHPWDREFEWLSACSRVVLPRASVRERV